MFSTFISQPRPRVVMYWMTESKSADDPPSSIRKRKDVLKAYEHKEDFPNTLKSSWTVILIMAPIGIGL